MQKRELRGPYIKRQRTCIVCGETFMGGSRAEYCLDHKIIRRQEVKNRWQRNDRASK